MLRAFSPSKRRGAATEASTANDRTAGAQRDSCSGATGGRQPPELRRAPRRTPFKNCLLARRAGQELPTGALGGLLVCGVVVEVYSNSSSAPNSASSTFLRRPSFRATAAMPPTTRTIRRLPRRLALRLRLAPRSA